MVNSIRFHSTEVHVRARKKTYWVSASDVGRASFCPYYLQLKNSGARVSEEAKAAREAGDKGHDDINWQARSDKRCYAASHLYGADDPRTEFLREFRDRRLLSSKSGRVIVWAYYRVSPSLVALSRNCNLLERAIAWVIDRLITVLEKSA